MTKHLFPPSMQVHECRFLFSNDTWSVRHVLAGVLSGFGTRWLSAEDRSVLELVLAEVLNNIVEHAYPAGMRGVIELSVAVSDDAVACEVTDRGRPMPGACLPEGRLPDTGDDQGDLPEGGFGWYLIRRLTRSVKYRRIGNRNNLAFVIPLGAEVPVLEPIRNIG